MDGPAVPTDETEHRAWMRGWRSVETLGVYTRSFKAAGAKDGPALPTDETEHESEVGAAREPLAFPGGAKRTGPWMAREYQLTKPSKDARLA
jgi:hypothetical protein